MDFPPLDDTRWDRLLGAVIGQRPTVGDPDAPLATTFPGLVDQRATESVGEDVVDAENAENTDAGHRSVDLDAYA